MTALALALVGCRADVPRPAPPLRVGDLAAILGRPDPEGWRHREAVEALGTLGDPKAVGALAAVIEADPGKHEFFLRRLAARALGGIADARAAEVLARNLLRSEGPLRLEDDCRWALARIGKAAVPALSVRIRAESEVAVSAALALGGIRDPAARAVLERARDQAIGPLRRAIDEALAVAARMWEKSAPDSGVNR